MSEPPGGSPAWFRELTTPLPTPWLYILEEFTTEDSVEEWGFAAGVFIAHTRKRTGEGPTFRELFAHLLADPDGLPGDFPPGLNRQGRWKLRDAFYMNALLPWRHRQMIRWSPGVTRSLALGSAFRKRSRTHTRELARSRAQTSTASW